MKEAKNEIHISLHVFGFNFATEVAKTFAEFLSAIGFLLSKRKLYTCIASQAAKKYALKEFQRKSVSENIEENVRT